MKAVRLGLVGMGMIWERAHRPVLERLEDSFQVKDFCTSRTETRKKSENLYPKLRSFESYQALVRSPEIDAVVVLTPIQLNAAVAIAALDAGKDVYLEKPMALSVADGQKVIESERRSGNTVYVLENLVYSKRWTVVEETIRSGKIGSPAMFDWVEHFFLDSVEDSTGGFGKIAWRIKGDFPLGTLFDGGIHNISLITKLFGRPTSIIASGSKLRKDFGEYDHIAMLFQFSSGFTGFFR